MYTCALKNKCIIYKKLADHKTAKMLIELNSTNYSRGVDIKFVGRSFDCRI